MSPRSAAALAEERPWLEAAEAFLAERAGREPAWLEARRREALARFRESGFPTSRDEDWRFTNPAPIVRTAFRPAPRARPAPGALDALDLGDAAKGGTAFRLVFVNGRLEESLSRFPDPATRVVAGSLAAALSRFGERLEGVVGRHALAEGRPFVALNQALFQDGAFVHVPRETCLPVPLHLVFLSVGGAEPVACHPRTVVLLDPGSRATIIETHADLVLPGQSGGTVLTNAVTEVVLGPNSHLERAKVGQQGPDALHVAATEVRQERDSAFASLDVTLGARFSRNDLGVTLAGEGGTCELDGLYVASGREHVVHQTRIDHAVPRCSSRELYKGVLDGAASAVFAGRVLVREGAQKTDARQANHNLLLGDEAVVDTKPMLEILADDVKCAHGATVGQIDEDALFYLQSRGIGLEAARAVLVHAFASEVIRREATPALEARLERLIARRLPGGTT